MAYPLGRRFVQGRTSIHGHVCARNSPALECRMFCVAALRTRAKPLRRMAAIPVMWEGQAVIRGPQSLESHGAWGCSRAPFYLLVFHPKL